ncbi:FAD-dependent oxidoreductase [Leucobacter sp. VD1]|uniref:FAD-dependent oxidoreductase n=1 Tax=Leucobacter sp. VD1 TaxID=3080381 RepID=UPI003017012C
MSAQQHEVAVVGAGPAGLCVAAELRRLGVDVAVYERRQGAAPGSRAIGVHPPTLAALEASGATERMLTEAARIPRGLARTREGRVLGEVRFDSKRRRFPFVAAVPQAVTEAALAFGAPAPIRDAEVQQLAPDGPGAILLVRVGGAEVEVRARAVVLAAGAGSRSRLLPAARPRGRAYSDSYLMTDLRHAPGQPGDLAIITLDGAGVVESFPLSNGGRRLVAWDGPLSSPGSGSGWQSGSGSRDATDPERDAAARAERLRLAVAERSGEQDLAANIETATGFAIRCVLLPRMRSGALFVIGDAAHEVSPIGGQGMNLGLLDAVTLAPALASWLRRGAGESQSEGTLDHWERRRLASARTAARLAGLNTSIGRARHPRGHRALTATIGATARGPIAQLAAHAYTMGFDRDAA